MKRRIIVALMTTILSGCMFAPSKYGSRGMVRPDSAQFRQYLRNCRSMSERLDVYCRDHGDPAAIQIGHSGGLFIWLNPQKMITIRSFGSTSECDSIPPSIVGQFQRLEKLSDQVKRIAEPTAKDIGVSVRSLDYDEETHKGIIRVSFREGCFQEARDYARRMIEKVDSDKNVVLVSGQKATAGLFRIGNERVLEANLLEMEFCAQ